MMSIQMGFTTIQPLIIEDTLDSNEFIEGKEAMIKQLIDKDLLKEPSINQIIYSYYRQFAEEKNALELTNLYIKNWLKVYLIEFNKNIS